MNTPAEDFTQEVERLKSLNDKYQEANEKYETCRRAVALTATYSRPISTLEKVVGGIFIAAAGVKFIKWCLR